MQKAVILFSGGLDSTVLLAWLKRQGFLCYALTVFYGQRHHQEIAAAKNIVQQISVEQHRIIHLEISQWGGSSLTDPTIEVAHQWTQEIPNTYVPARNTVFLAAALSWAQALNVYDIYIGANKQDYDHYPDCRQEYFDAFNQLANMNSGITNSQHYHQEFSLQQQVPLRYHVHAPFINKNKEEIIKIGQELNVPFAATFSCYDPVNNQACGVCEACYLRQQGFSKRPVIMAQE